jgi:hypothetical protein
VLIRIRRGSRRNGAAIAAAIREMVVRRPFLSRRACTSGTCFLGLQRVAARDCFWLASSINLSTVTCFPFLSGALGPLRKSSWSIIKSNTRHWEGCSESGSTSIASFKPHRTSLPNRGHGRWNRWRANCTSAPIWPLSRLSTARCIQLQLLR